MKTKKNRSRCPVNFAVEHFGDKWSLLIMRDILLFGKQYYNEFLASNERISTNILADRLSVLEKEGMIRKNKDEKHGSKYVYTPTQKGIDLKPILMEMMVWSLYYDSRNTTSPDFIERLKKDRSGALDELLSWIKKSS